MTRPLDRLFLLARQSIPALTGQEVFLNNDANVNISRLVTVSDQKLIDLHLSLKQAHPETKASYWRIRSWGLVNWQPIYLAMICVYQLGKVPMTLGRVKQTQQGVFVAGYGLENGEWLEGSHDQLIHLAAIQLKQILMSLETIFGQLFDGKPVMYRALFVDQLLESLVQASQLSLLSSKQVFNDAPIWIKALGLSANALSGLNYRDNEVSFVRLTCCLHYQRNDGDLCVSCPRLKAKKVVHVPT